VSRDLLVTALWFVGSFDGLAVVEYRGMGLGEEVGCVDGPPATRKERRPPRIEHEQDADLGCSIGSGRSSFKFDLRADDCVDERTPQAERSFGVGAGTEFGFLSKFSATK
jgi:hypothetical protein